MVRAACSVERHERACVPSRETQGVSGDTKEYHGISREVIENAAFMFFKFTFTRYCTVRLTHSSSRMATGSELIAGAPKLLLPGGAPSTCRRCVRTGRTLGVGAPAFGAT